MENSGLHFHIGGLGLEFSPRYDSSDTSVGVRTTAWNWIVGGVGVGVCRLWWGCLVGPEVSGVVVCVGGIGKSW